MGCINANHGTIFVEKPLNNSTTVFAMSDGIANLNFPCHKRLSESELFKIGDSSAEHPLKVSFPG